MINEPDVSISMPGDRSGSSLPPVRSDQQGVALSRLRAWHRCLLSGGDDAAREAALTGPVFSPVPARTS